VRVSRPIADEIQGLVEGVVRANQEFRARVREYGRRREEKLSRFIPLIQIDISHVVGKGIRVHRDLRVIVRTEEGRTLHTYRAVAEGGAFGADADDSHVF